MSMETYTWCPLGEAWECEREDPHSHISIQSPGADSFTPKCKREILSLFFIDFNPRELKLKRAEFSEPERADELASACMSVAEAHDIVTFVENHPGPVVVNCEVGISRSPGVVLALREWYGGSAWDVIRDTVPNMHIAFTLAHVLRLRDCT